jgi:hypothetical protein
VGSNPAGRAKNLNFQRRQLLSDGVFVYENIFCRRSGDSRLRSNELAAFSGCNATDSSRTHRGRSGEGPCHVRHRERLHGMGYEPIGNTPAQMAKVVAEEQKRWAEILKAADIAAQDRAMGCRAQRVRVDAAVP